MSTAQIISAIQRKGGACKSTMLQCIAAKMGMDGARVLIIDTDPQASCVEWAGEQDIKNVDTLAHLDEEKMTDIIEKLGSQYDAILIDTAGYDSMMSVYAMTNSHLVLIPSGGSKSNVMGAARTWKHVEDTTKNLKHPPLIRVAFWGVKKNSNVYNHAAQAMKAANIPTIDSHVGNLVGFEAMSWNGGLPNGVAALALNQFMAALQNDGLLDFYNQKGEGAVHGQAA